MRESLSAVEKRSRTQREILEPVLVDVLQSSLTSHVSGPGALSCLVVKGWDDFQRSWLLAYFRAQDFCPPRLRTVALYVAGSKRGNLAYHNM